MIHPAETRSSIDSFSQELQQWETKKKLEEGLHIAHHGIPQARASISLLEKLEEN
jgi:hypothetical protein